MKSKYIGLIRILWSIIILGMLFAWILKPFIKRSIAQLAFLEVNEERKGFFFGEWSDYYMDLLRSGMRKEDVVALTGLPQNKYDENVWLWVNNYEKIQLPSLGKSPSWKIILKHGGKGYFLVFKGNRLYFAKFLDTFNYDPAEMEKIAIGSEYFSSPDKTDEHDKNGTDKITNSK